ncbi:major capsid protein [Fibrella forsythiae]|uniref:Major capsid protein n=1 Tax=Fibrella forsythiae TaxID=2817061 RepID=A0ABS3JBC0_9BACT|nr:major capsid protein [Fibrella forsythiae]MBO0947287.1 major capsid protein [Fibrella forsythiae]
MKYASIFGNYALGANLQITIDENLDRFAPNFYPRYFDWAPIQQSLTFTAVIGRSRIEAAASVVARDSTTPLRARAALEKYTGEIPAIKEMFKMTESDYREFENMQALNVDEALKLKQLLDYLFADVKKVGDSAHKRLDIFALQALSTGYVQLDTTNNPDGLVTDGQIDLLMPATNRIDSLVSWGDSVNATPLQDVQSAVELASKRGIRFEKILMSWALYQKFRRAKEVKDTMSLAVFGKVGAGDISVATSLKRINEYLSEQEFPIIEVINEQIGVEKDGKIGNIQPFDENNASFVPSGKLGLIKNALAIEQSRPVGAVSYGTYNRACISKWSENEPFGEWTKVELNAFPAVDAIDSIHILKAIR